MTSSRLAVSNIAWDPAEDDAVAEALRADGAGGVEIAPTKWRERPLNATARDVAAYRRAWSDRGLDIVSMQSLLYGRPDLQMFADETSRTSMVDYLRRVIDLGAALGARVLVFGSPKNRTRGRMTEREATNVAVDVFRELAIHAHEQNVVFCLEANPPAYSCDFLTATADAVALCRLIDHPGLRVNGDLGGMTMSGEDPVQSITDAGAWIGHFHASEPQLAAVGDEHKSDHDGAALGLATIGYTGWVSVEMRSVMPFASQSNVDAVSRAVRVTRTAYDSVIA